MMRTAYSSIQGGLLGDAHSTKSWLTCFFFAAGLAQTFLESGISEIPAAFKNSAIPAPLNRETGRVLYFGALSPCLLAKGLRDTWSALWKTILQEIWRSSRFVTRKFELGTGGQLIFFQGLKSLSTNPLSFEWHSLIIVFDIDPAVRERFLFYSNVLCLDLSVAHLSMPKYEILEVTYLIFFFRTGNFQSINKRDGQVVKNAFRKVLTAHEITGKICGHKS